MMGAVDEPVLESPVVFDCEGDRLVSILHRPSEDVSVGIGMVIVVAGGPQYRAGAHRQFVQLARFLCSRGITVLRFDLRGMGDSEGVHRGYLDSAPDIHSAVDTLLGQNADLKHVFLFGECESASGIAFYAYTDERIDGVVLVNPWVRTEEGQAITYVKHYYLNRLFSRELWKKIFSGDMHFVDAISSFVTNIRQSITAKGKAFFNKSREGVERDLLDLPLPLRTVRSLSKYSGRILFVISGNDYIAKEFDEAVSLSDEWRNLMSNDHVIRKDIEAADHTFSKEEWKSILRSIVFEWMFEGDL